MAMLTLFEHQTIPFDWTDNDLAALERINRALNAEVLRATIRGTERCLQAQQWVGVVRLGGQTVQILPKIYCSTEGTSEQQVHEATRNLLYLLAYAHQLPIQETAVMPLLQRNLDWLELLTYLFAAHLTTEWQRGAHRGYERVEAELPLLKGQWRVAEQLRRPALQHRFAVAYDEFSADNALNRVFRFVVERLWSLSRDSTNRRLLGDLRQWLDEVTLLPVVTAAAAAPTLITRLNQRYAPLLNLARLFLEGSALQLAGGQLAAFAFVFDMNQLFETFLVNFISRHRAEILPPALQTCELLPQAWGAARYLARAEKTGQSVFQLRPDLALRQAGTFPLLVDAKYKRLKTQAAHDGVSQADFYQMHAYARRYECPQVLLVYPQTVAMPEPLQRTFVLEAGAHRITAATIDLRVDLATPHGRAQLIQELHQLIGGYHAIQ